MPHPPPPPSTLHHRRSPLLPPVLAAAIALAFFFLFVILYRKVTRRRTVPSPTDLKPPFPPQRFSFSLLRRSTDSFSAANRLGQGGFGSVFKGILPSGQEIAVKLMSEASTQGEREFHNELSLASSIDTVCCPYVVCVLGFSTSENKRDHKFRYYGRRKKRRGIKLALVYEYMRNGSLQDALLDRKCVELMQWNKRFAIITSIAKGLDYLHRSCDPPIVHGDIKPSNILLDCNFDAKIADFGLAHVLNREEEMAETETVIAEEKIEKKGDACGSIIEENDSFATEDAVIVNVEQLQDDGYCVRIIDGDEGVGVSETSPSEGLDRMSVDSGNRKGIVGREKSEDWWWKQENTSGLSDSGRVKDYVMEWIGSEINKERPKKEWIKRNSSIDNGVVAKVEKKKKLEWWSSLDRKEKRNRKPREWWKEEFCNELAKKKKKRAPKLDSNEDQLWWRKDEEGDRERKRRRKNRGSSRSISNDGWSEEFRIGRRNSRDRASSYDIPKSGGISSTPSMRGTVCYTAPEYGSGPRVSDKCDVYSFGVLLLVVVSGRRPLQVMASSPMSEFERANLISWARQLALNGKMLDLVDTNIDSLDREEAALCITVALLCLQRSPDKRPTMGEIVGMLEGESEPPNLPFEFSPSPPSDFAFKSRKKRSPDKRPTMGEIVGMLEGESKPPNLPFEFSPSPPSDFAFKSRKKVR